MEILWLQSKAQGVIKMKIKQRDMMQTSHAVRHRCVSLLCLHFDAVVHSFTGFNLFKYAEVPFFWAMSGCWCQTAKASWSKDTAANCKLRLQLRFTSFIQTKFQTLSNCLHSSRRCELLTQSESDALTNSCSHKRRRSLLSRRNTEGPHSK